MNATAPQALWLAACAALIAAAVWHDVKDNRIPNRLVAAGLAAGLLLSASPGGIGLPSAAIGAVAGLAVLLPFYAMGVMGAGDAKLMAALGAFAGWPGVLAIALYALLAGGVLALGAAIVSGNWRQVLRNLHAGALNLLARASLRGLPHPGGMPVSAARIPYAVALGAGTAAHVAMRTLS